MEGRRIDDIEIWIGLLLIVIGFTLWWWSKQLLWILIYPPPWAKLLVDSLPFVLGGLGTLLVIDGVRRKQKDRQNEKKTVN